MAYREMPQLSPHIACLWTRDPRPVARTKRILPDACVDIVWTGDDLIVAGPATGPSQSAIAPNAAVMGVRFRVGAAGAALGLPAAELVDLSVPLAEIWGGEVTETVGEHPTIQTLAAAVQLRLSGEPDRLVRAAATGAEPGIGARHLRRRFQDAVGYGPKTLQRVLRFQRFLTLARRDTSAPPDLARLAFEAGYADQAHLTRECSRLAGLPPAALLASGAGPAGERSVSFKTVGPVATTLAA